MKHKYRFAGAKRMFETGTNDLIGQYLRWFIWIQLDFLWINTENCSERLSRNTTCHTFSMRRIAISAFIHLPHTFFGPPSEICCANLKFWSRFKQLVVNGSTLNGWMLPKKCSSIDQKRKEATHDNQFNALMNQRTQKCYRWYFLVKKTKLFLSKLVRNYPIRKWNGLNAATKEKNWRILLLQFAIVFLVSFVCCCVVSWSFV